MRRSSRAAARAALGLVLALAVQVGARPAAAFCRTAACPGGTTGTLCDPAAPNDCQGGKALFWPSPCVGFSLQEDASAGIDLAIAEQVFPQAFATWTNAPCAGGEPRLEVEYAGVVACDKHEYNQKQGNANAIIFRDDGWPYTNAGSTLALTTVTYNLETGEIYDADMEMNSKGTAFTTGNDGVAFDLLSIATHEAGHFLGISHSPVKEATMYPDYMPGSVSLRDLAPDDVDAMCAAYPPGDPVPATCDATPRHGFASECSTTEDPQNGCCSVAPGGARRGSGAGVAVTLGVLALLARRVRRARGEAPAREPRSRRPARELR